MLWGELGERRKKYISNSGRVENREPASREANAKERKKINTFYSLTNELLIESHFFIFKSQYSMQ